MGLLFKERYIFSSISLLFTVKIISINPTSILNTGTFSSIPLPLRESVFFYQSSFHFKVTISNNLATI